LGRNGTQQGPYGPRSPGMEKGGYFSPNFLM